MSQCSTVVCEAWPIQTPIAAECIRPPCAIVQSRITLPVTAASGSGSTAVVPTSTPPAARSTSSHRESVHSWQPWPSSNA